MATAGDCLRCGLPPAECGCFEHFADSWEPAAAPASGVYIHIHRERGPYWVDPGVFSVRVEVGPFAKAEDLRRVEPVILAWRNALNCWCGPGWRDRDIEEEVLWELFQNLGSYGMFAKSCNEAIQAYLDFAITDQPDGEAFFKGRDLPLLEPFDSLHPEGAVGSCRVMLEVLGWPSGVRSENRRKQEIGQFIASGLAEARKSRSCTMPEHPVDRLLAQTFIRRLRDRAKRADCST